MPEGADDALETSGVAPQDCQFEAHPQSPLVISGYFFFFPWHFFPDVSRISRETREFCREALHKNLLQNQHVF